MARYNTLDNQAPVQQELKSSDPKVGRSAFDYSHIHCGTSLIGALVPVLCMEVVPNEDIDINLNALVQIRNPLTRPLLNGMRVYFHGYCNYLVDLWEGAKNFLDAGRSGTISLQRPNLLYRATYNGIEYNAASPLSLLAYLGMPAQIVKTHYHANDLPFEPILLFITSAYRLGGSNFHALSGAPDFFPADVCMAYQRNWRDFYSNKNLLQNNKYWFPDNEDNFILSYECVEAVAVNHGNEDLGKDPELLAKNLYGPADGQPLFVLTPEPNNPQTYGDGLSELWRAPNLSGLKFRQFKGDRFVTGSPFPELLRGDIPVLTHPASTGVYSRDIYPFAAYNYFSNGSGPISGPEPVRLEVEGPGQVSFYRTESDSSGIRQVTSGDIIPFGTNITLNDIRALETFTVFKERMARTNGDYNNMIEAQFGYNPHHHVREATYIGGFYMDFHMSTVVQQSASTQDDALGTKAGDANANGSGRIGHIHTRDYGWIQVYMSIVPDVFYTQGLQRQFSRKVQTDMYFPLFNNLAPQAILNKELFISGSPSKDNDVFAYEDRYAEFKHCNNRVTGLMALPHEVAEYDASRIMARRFSSTPALNNQFISLVPENVDMSVFTVTDEPPFDFQIGFNIRRVAPMPYVSIPGSMSSNLHA